MSDDGPNGATSRDHIPAHIRAKIDAQAAKVAAAAPPVTEAQRDRLRLIFRNA